MLSLIEDLPEGVVGVKAEGKVTAEDYEQVLRPAVEAAKNPEGKVRLLYVLAAEFPDFTVEAAWADARLGIGELSAWERIAVVSDAGWLRHAIQGLGWLMPGDVKVFPADELERAREWVS